MRHTAAIAAALVTTAAHAGDVAEFDEIPFFDFTDQYYLDNGVDPDRIIGRVAPGFIAVEDQSPDPEFFRDLRVLLVIPCWDHEGDPAFISAFGEVGPEGFTDNAAGREAREIADEYPLYLFPRQGAPLYSPAQKRQNDLVPLNNGYFSGDPLGLWEMNFVHFTPAAFNTAAGRAALDQLADRNGYDLDGTPVFKTEAEILQLQQQGYVELLLRPLDNAEGGRWSICPTMKDPRDGALLPDNILGAALEANGQPTPAESELVQEFDCLVNTGDWCNTLACPGDIAAPIGQLDLADLSAFAQAFGTQNPAADLYTDGVLDLEDISYLIQAFTAGCP